MKEAATRPSDAAWWWVERVVRVRGGERWRVEGATAAALLLRTVRRPVVRECVVGGGQGA